MGHTNGQPEKPQEIDTSESLAYIVDKAHQRRERWIHSEVMRLPTLKQVTEPTIVGSFSFCLQESRQRILKAPDCIPVDHVIETPSAIARDYAMFEYKRGPRVKHSQIQTIRDGMRAAPNFTLPTVFDYGFYVDIKAAYWSIMNVVGWNVDYWPEKFLARGKPPYRFPFPEHKLARNCLASVGLCGELPIYYPAIGQIVGTQTGNALANLSIMRVITDVLQSIAAQAIELGVVYCNTDGFIAPNEVVLDKLENLIREWSLESRVKMDGPGAVHSSGAFSIGNHKSGLVDLRNADAVTLGVKPVRYSAWLQKAFTFWAAK